MNPKTKLVLMLFLLLIVALALSPIASAKSGGKVTMKRAAHELKVGLGRTPFGSGAAHRKDSCSGWCTCSDCGCDGSLSCCIGGCEACWEYRDSRGYCNAT
jgi:hypothetical protein